MIDSEKIWCAIPVYNNAGTIADVARRCRAQIARVLSAQFDFVRVDLYSVGDKVYFGELTCTPHQGYGVIRDPRIQKLRDELWQLDASNPRLYNAPPGYGLAATQTPALIGRTAPVSRAIRS